MNELRILPPERARRRAATKIAEFQKKKAVSKSNALQQAKGKENPTVVEKKEESPAKKIGPEKQKKLNELLWSNAKSNNAKQVERLLDAGADVNSDDGGFDPLTNRMKVGWTALMYASNRGNLESAKVLINAGADLDAKSDDGWTAIIMASGNGYLKVVKVLVEAGADINAINDGGQTALDKARYWWKWRVARFLKKQGAKRGDELP